MSYKYETHMHTLPGSACARDTGAAMARAYLDAGYDGIIVTDHFFNGNTGVPKGLLWEDRVKIFLSGYEEAREEGERIGLSVFLGWEYNYRGAEFLTYGLDENFLLANPGILSLMPEEYFDLVHISGGIIVHAHPFREAPYIEEMHLCPDYVDAVEIYNGRNLPEYNQKAVEYAKKYNLPETSGSDCHFVDEPKLYGIELDERLTDINDFIDKVKRRAGQLIR